MEPKKSRLQQDDKTCKIGKNLSGTFSIRYFHNLINNRLYLTVSSLQYACVLLYWILFSFRQWCKTNLYLFIYSVIIHGRSYTRWSNDASQEVREAFSDCISGKRNNYPGECLTITQAYCRFTHVINCVQSISL